jgi:hypothetical protein
MSADGARYRVELNPSTRRFEITYFVDEDDDASYRRRHGGAE